MTEPTTPERPAIGGLFDKVVNLCKRRGFIFPSAEIYGGFRSTYDYGPLGVNMLRNVKDAWWRAMVQLRDDVVGLDAAILSPPAVWAASGHLAEFADPLVECRSCHSRWRSSPAALRVKVTTSTCSGVASPSATRRATRRVSTRVLPDPAPATMHSARSAATTAAACASERPPSSRRLTESSMP